MDTLRLPHFFLGKTNDGGSLVFRQTENIPHAGRDGVELVGAQVEITTRDLEKKDGGSELESPVVA